MSRPRRRARGGRVRALGGDRAADHRPAPAQAQSIQTSLDVVVRNPLAMVVWSALIAAIMIAGFASLLFGMIVLIPMLGHASWHAYRGLVE